MRHLRGLTLFCVVILVAACGGGGDHGAGRDPVRPVAAVRTTTTTSVEEVAAVAAEAPAVPAPATDLPGSDEAEDPVPAGAPGAAGARPPRKAAGKRAPTGHIEIPAIGLSHATYEGIDLATINHGPSHWPGTAQPGEPGNTVFPGHRTTYSRPFWDIDKLVAGNEVIFTTPGGRFTYQVTETFVVGARDTWIVNPTGDATFTIFACHPKGSARQRYVAKGRLVSASAPTASAAGGGDKGGGSGGGGGGGSATTSTTAAPTTTTTAPQDIVPDLPGD